MKRISIIACLAAGFSSLTAQATSYVSNFSGLGVGQTLEGVDGWQQSEPTFVEEDIEYPWAFGTEIGVGANLRPAAGVGGFYNTVPPASAGSFYTFHTLSFADGMIFSMNLALVDSLAFDSNGVSYGAERNAFQLGFYDQGVEVFALVFDPNVDPDEPDAQINPNDTWNVSASSRGIKSTASMAMVESQLYSLNLTLLPNGQDLNYNFSLTATNTLRSNGTLIGLGASPIDELRIGIDPLEGAYGTNHLVFEGVTAAVPEPSSLVMLACATGALALRRRRIE